MFFSPDFLTNPQEILLAVFLLFAAIQLFYFWFYFSRVAFYKEKTQDSNSDQPPVSVIICAKNEYENLKENLPLVLEQDYPSYEVILVNDFSEDETFFLLKSLESKYKHFKVINLRGNVNFFEGKKLALAVGIKSAAHEIVLLTDADCRPAGKHWIRHMAAGFTAKKDIVLGYGGYERKPGFLNALIRFDTLVIAMQYMGFALAGRPYMGVGRNLAYRKSLFFKSGGFASHYKIKSGDDDLFINKVADKKNTSVVLDPRSHTFSNPKETFGAWFRQKKRHLSTGVYYRFMHKLRLGLFSISTFFFYACFIASLFFAQTYLSLLAVLGLFLLRTISMVLMHYYAGKRLSEQKLFIYSPIFDLILVLLNPVFALSNIFYRKNKWK